MEYNTNARFIESSVDVAPQREEVDAAETLQYETMYADATLAVPDRQALPEEDCIAPSANAVQSALGAMTIEKLPAAAEPAIIQTSTALGGISIGPIDTPESETREAEAISPLDVSAHEIELETEIGRKSIDDTTNILNGAHVQSATDHVLPAELIPNTDGDGSRVEHKADTEDSTLDRRAGGLALLGDGASVAHASPLRTEPILSGFVEIDAAAIPKGETDDSSTPASLELSGTKAAHVESEPIPLPNAEGGSSGTGDDGHYPPEDTTGFEEQPEDDDQADEQDESAETAPLYQHSLPDNFAHDAEASKLGGGRRSVYRGKDERTGVIVRVMNDTRVGWDDTNNVALSGRRVVADVEFFGQDGRLLIRRETRTDIPHEASGHARRLASSEKTPEAELAQGLALRQIREMSSIFQAEWTPTSEMAMRSAEYYLHLVEQYKIDKSSDPAQPNEHRLLPEETALVERVVSLMRPVHTDIVFHDSVSTIAASQSRSRARAEFQKIALLLESGDVDWQSLAGRFKRPRSVMVLLGCLNEHIEPDTPFSALRQRARELIQSSDRISELQKKRMLSLYGLAPEDDIPKTAAQLARQLEISSANVTAVENVLLGITNPQQYRRRKRTEETSSEE